MRREEFLSWVSSAILSGDIPSPPLVEEHLPEFDPTDLVGLFRSRAQQASAVVHGPFSRHGIPRSITGIAAGHQCESFMAWEDLPTPGVATALTSAGLERTDHHVPVEARYEHLSTYARVDLGVTSAIAGLAESGSVVLSHGEGRPRLASLVPEVHVVLLDTTTIDRTLANWAARHPDVAAETANLVIVTGPSRTADIEQTLTLGVHGPRHVHVVLMK